VSCDVGQLCNRHGDELARVIGAVTRGANAVPKQQRTETSETSPFVRLRLPRPHPTLHLMRERFVEQWHPHSLSRRPPGHADAEHDP